MHFYLKKYFKIKAFNLANVISGSDQEFDKKTKVVDTWMIIIKAK